MQFLSLFNAYVHSTMTVLAAASTDAATDATIPGVTSAAKLIAEFGILVVIAAMMMLFMWKQMNNVIKRDNKLYDELSPRLTAIQDDLKADIFKLESEISKVNQNISLLINNHNAHSNQTLKAMEKDQSEMSELLIQNLDAWRETVGQITAIGNNVNMIMEVLMRRGDDQNNDHSEHHGS